MVLTQDTLLASRCLLIHCLRLLKSPLISVEIPKIADNIKRGRMIWTETLLIAKHCRSMFNRSSGRKPKERFSGWLSSSVTTGWAQVAPG